MNVQDALNRTPLIWAAALNRPRTVELLLEHMADVSRVDKHNKTALHWAMVSQAAEVAELLLNPRASLEARDCFGRTPLHKVAKVSRSTELINLPIKHGASVDARDDIHERTPLHLAANPGRADNVLALLANRADIGSLTLPSYRTP
ncbi:ankyrin repeat-containing domain protein [Ilyonectria destructans]|nr:ankyrin repeat-containing domain protein [Ilyonectria destructans]